MAFFRDRERPDTESIWAFAALATALAGHTLLETARDALFLVDLSPTYLPWMYLAIAVVTLVITEHSRRRGKLLGNPRVLAPFLLLSGVVTGTFWFFASEPTSALLITLYLWGGIFGTLSTLHMWLALNRRYTVTEAKKAFGFIGAGSIVGALAGSAGARAITEYFSTRHLLVFAAGAVVLSAIASHLWARSSARRTENAVSSEDDSRPVQRTRARQDLSEVVRNPYLRLIGLMVIAITVAVTIGDYIFKSTAAREIRPENLGEFFATVYLGLNTLSLLVQVALVRYLMRVLGPAKVVATLPLLLGGAAAWGIGGGGLASAIALKGADGCFKHSLHKTALEVLWVPVQHDVRERTKPFLDVLGHRGGQALASLVILSIAAFVSDTFLSVGIIVLAAGASFLAWRLRRRYLELFRINLEESATPDKRLPPLDRHALEVLLHSLNSPRDVQVVAALDVFAAHARVDLVPLLVLYHPSASVVTRALEHFVGAGRPDFVPIAIRLLERDDAQVRAAALRAIGTEGVDEEVLREAIDDRSPVVAWTARVFLVAAGLEPRAALDQGISSSSVGIRRAVAEALALSGKPELEDALVALTADGDAAVRRTSIEGLSRVAREEHIDVLIAALGRRETRRSAHDGLVAIGGPAFVALKEQLASHDTPDSLRLQIPRAIARFGDDAAATLLLERYLIEVDSTVRHRTVRALNKLYAEHPETKVNEEQLDDAVHATIAEALELLHFESVVADEGESPTTSARRVLTQLLSEKRGNVEEMLFRLFQIRIDSEDFERIHRGLHSEDPELHASGQELFAEAVPDPFREVSVALVSGAPHAETLEAGRNLYDASEALSLSDVLRKCIAGPSRTLRCVAAHHAAELGWTDLIDAIEEALASAETDYEIEALEVSRARLGEPERSEPKGGDVAISR